MSRNAGDQIVLFTKTATLSQLERLVYDLIAGSTRWNTLESDDVARYFMNDLLPSFIARVSAAEETPSITPLASNLTSEEAKRVVFNVLGRLRTTDEGKNTELYTVINGQEVDDSLCATYIDDLDGMQPLSANQ